MQSKAVLAFLFHITEHRENDTVKHTTMKGGGCSPEAPALASCPKG